MKDVLILVTGVALLGCYLKWRQSLKQDEREADRQLMLKRLNSGTYDHIWGENNE